METNKIYLGDCLQVIKSDSLEFLKNQADYENDIIFADPPYALGSEVIIRKDGKADIANARIKHYKENEYVQLDLFGGE